jgi:hypothetical protein
MAKGSNCYTFPIQLEHFAMVPQICMRINNERSCVKGVKFTRTTNKNAFIRSSTDIGVPIKNVKEGWVKPICLKLQPILKSKITGSV